MVSQRLKYYATRARNFVVQDRKRARLNKLHNIYELRRRKLHLKSYPHILYMDTTTMCNLKCPFCPTGTGTSNIPKKLLQRDTFKAIVSNIRTDLLLDVYLYNWGEPFLNANTFEYIRYFADRNIRTTISSNLSVKDYDDEWLEGLVRSGLNYITASIDGASQETYSMYRRSGNFERVIGNIRRLSEVKKRLNSPWPFVTYRMLLNRFNEHEIETGKNIAAEIGAAFSADVGFYIPPEQRADWQATSIREEYGAGHPKEYFGVKPTIIHTECRQLWDTLLVNVDGAIFPCCIISDINSTIDNLAEKHIDQVWNGEKYVALRRFAVDPDCTTLPFANNCEGCEQRYCSRLQVAIS